MSSHVTGQQPTQEQTQLAAALRRHVETLASEPRNGRSNPAGLTRAREYVSSHLEEAGWRVELDEFSTPLGLAIGDKGGGSIAWPTLRSGIRGVNVVAKHGPAGPGPLVIAHLDTVQASPGADDNASGVAIALEVASTISRDHPALPATVALVDLEERYMLGSTHLAKTLTPAPSLVICLDSVGVYDSTPGSQHLPDGTGMLWPGMVRQIKDLQNRADFLLVVHRRSTAAAARHWKAAAAEAGLDTVLLQDRRSEKLPLPGLRRWFNPVAANLDRSDHVPFWTRNIPALFVTGTANLRHQHYHHATDTPDLLDYEAMARAHHATVATALRSTPPDQER